MNSYFRSLKWKALPLAALVLSSTFLYPSSIFAASVGYEPLHKNVVSDFSSGKSVDAIKKYFFSYPDVQKKFPPEKQAEMLNKVNKLMVDLGSVLKTTESYRAKCVAEVYCSVTALFHLDNGLKPMVLRYYKNPKTKDWRLLSFSLSHDIDEEFKNDALMEDK